MVTTPRRAVITEDIADLDARSALLGLPETGMGFQWVLTPSTAMPGPFLVFNAELLYDLSGIELLDGVDPALILANGSRVLAALAAEPAQPTIIARPEPTNFVLLGARVGLAARRSGAGGVGAQGPQITQPSSLVKKLNLPRNRVFHRYSAFSPDWRVDPKTGSLRPGTYVVPESEVPFIPTGFAAVGRLALPNLQPASHHYVVKAPAGTSVEFGTVAPAFGQAGGGVEALLPNGAKNQQVPPASPSTIPDE